MLRPVSILLTLFVLLTTPSYGQNAHAQDFDTSPFSTEALRLGLDQSPQWQALLHISEGRRWIDNPEFLLSYGEFSYQLELSRTLALLYQDKQAVCRFPARYHWLRQHMPELPELSLNHCDDLQTFLRNVPADEVALVFASENLSSPSSMMGHVFLNIGGERESGENVEYSVSYFTDIDTWNIPKVFYESIVTGRPGHFALSPYQDQVLRYLHEEQRNVWRYQLSLSQPQRDIVQYHLFELRDVPLTYYFHAYNCATLVNFVVAHAQPELLDYTRPWVTPLSVVRQSRDLVEQVSIMPSTEWLIRAHSENLDRRLVRAIERDISNPEGAEFGWLEPLIQPNRDPSEGLFALETARAYNDYRFDQRDVELDQWQAHEDHLNAAAANHFSGYQLDLSDYKDPLKSPAERQAQIGYRYTQDTQYVQLSLLPASHRLDDDNRQYFGESGLQLAELSLLVAPKTGATRVEHFKLYGMQSYMPTHPMVSTRSATIDLGYSQHYDAQLQRRGAWYAQGSLGRTWRLQRAIDLYATVGAGAGYSDGRSYLYAAPRLGVFVRQAHVGKLHAHLTSYSNQYDSAGYAELGLTQSWFINADSALVFELESRHSYRSAPSDQSFGVSYKRYF